MKNSPIATLTPRGLALGVFAATLVVCAAAGLRGGGQLQHTNEDHANQHANQENTMQVRYLEIVTPDMDETCDMLEAVHGVTFGDPIAALGNARTADLNSGGKISVRAPMRADEAPVVRPYMLVDDIEAAVEAAEAAGAQIAIPPMELPGQGTFAIYLLGGIDHGVWED